MSSIRNSLDIRLFLKIKTIIMFNSNQMREISRNWFEWLMAKTSSWTPTNMVNVFQTPLSTSKFRTIWKHNLCKDLTFIKLLTSWDCYLTIWKTLARIRRDRLSNHKLISRYLGNLHHKHNITWMINFIPSVGTGALALLMHPRTALKDL